MSFHTALTSGMVTLGAGAYGYAKTSSKPSLYGGAAIASVFLSSAYLLKNSDYQATGHSLAAAAGTVCLVLGARRLMKLQGPTRRVGPTILLAVGILNVPYQYMKACEWMS
jgi:uncharacterized membrane protein (UPF0136 family)